MKYVSFFCLTLFFCFSCSSNECQNCLGTNIQGATVSWTVCDNGDGSVTNTNNVTDSSAVVDESYAASIAFFESLNLDCE